MRIHEILNTKPLDDRGSSVTEGQAARPAVTGLDVVTEAVSKSYRQQPNQRSGHVTLKQFLERLRQSMPTKRPGE